MEWGGMGVGWELGGMGVGAGWNGGGGWVAGLCTRNPGFFFVQPYITAVSRGH